MADFLSTFINSKLLRSLNAQFLIKGSVQAIYNGDSFEFDFNDLELLY